MSGKPQLSSSVHIVVADYLVLVCDFALMHIHPCASTLRCIKGALLVGGMSAAAVLTRQDRAS